MVRVPQPTRHYPRLWIHRPSFGRPRDLNPPDQNAAQHTLRAHPPLCLASVLWPSWGFHLGFSLGIEATGSQVPCTSQDRTRATFMPDATLAVSGYSPELIPGQRLAPGFDVVLTLSTRHQWFTCVRLSDPHLTRSRRAFSLTLTTGALNHEPLKVVWSLPPQTGCEGPTLISNIHCLAHSRRANPRRGCGSGRRP